MCLYYKFPSGTASKSLYNGIQVQQPILLEHCVTQQRGMFVVSCNTFKLRVYSLY